MMPMENPLLVKLLETIVDHLDIPKSYYEKAVARHKSVGDWLCRPESKVAAFHPHVSSQGSFRYGTVNRPLLSTEEYDLDNVTTLTIDKTAFTQKQLKQLYGGEIKEYARANGMLEPIVEKNRCWRLVYADEVKFHLDTLPCLPEAPDVIGAIASRGVPLQLATLAVAITDRRHRGYDQITQSWLSSNPRGFALWFEQRTRSAALARMQELVAQRLYVSVEDVPPYEWKTPLQRSIQVFKRHRDVMFGDDPSVGPISMIITNLAAQAYAGESDLTSALTNIVERMPKYVNASRPRVPNPGNTAEDYADKWTNNPMLEVNFWAWHTQLKGDIAKLPAFLVGNNLLADIRNTFRVELSQEELKQFNSGAPATHVAAGAAPALHIPAAPRPWGERA